MSPTARLGAFMLIALVILGVFIIKIQEIPIGLSGARHTVQAEFPTVAGLDEKSPVRIAGVRVGLVEKISLSGDRALVTLALDPGVELHEGASAAVSSLGMLGDKYVELNPGPLSSPPLPEGTVLKGSSPVAFDQVLKTANDVGGDIKQVTASLRNSLGGPQGQARLDEILDNIRTISEQTKDLISANRQSVDATIANFRAFSQTLRDDLPTLAKKLNALADNVDSVVEQNRGNLAASLDNIKELSSQLRVSARNLNEITTKIASGQGSIGKLVNDDETVNNINSTLKSVESGVTMLKDTMGRVQRFRLVVNMRTEDLPGISDSRSAFGFDLHTTDRRFYRIELVDSPFGKLSTSTETVTTIHPDGTQDSYTVKKSKEDTTGYTFNAQVGYLLFPQTVVRAGLFESHGGVGADQYLLDHRLKLTLDAYDFNRDQHAPHLRLTGRYYFTKNIFAYTGWDDPTYSAHSSVILGGGISWTDEDLKYLLGTAASAAKP